MPPWLIIGGDEHGEDVGCAGGVEPDQRAVLSIANLCSFSQQGYVGNEREQHRSGALAAAAEYRQSQTGMVMLMR